MLTVLRAALPGFSVTLSTGADGGALFEILSADGAERLGFDGGPVLRALAGKGRRAADTDGMLAALVDAALNLASPEPLTPDAVFVVLRPGAFIAGYGETAISRATVGDCGSLLMQVRQDGRLAAVTHDQARLAKLSVDALWHAAHDRLRSVAARLVLQEYDYGVMSIEIAGHDWLGGSLLLAPQVLRQALERLGMARAYVCAPSRLTVDLVDAAAPDALTRGERWMADRLAESDVLSERVFAFSAKGGDWCQATPRAVGALIGALIWVVTGQGADGAGR